MTQRILVLGNSHAAALKEAEPHPDGIAVHWLRTKPGRGDIDVPDALALAQTLGEGDVLVLMRLGSAHNILGLLNHEIPFSLVGGMAPGEDVAMIPEAVMRTRLAAEGPADRILARLAARVRCRLAHVMPPPPRRDLPQTSASLKVYRGRPLAAGFSPAPRRLALWRLEKAVTDDFLRGIGITPIDPPPETLTAEGYLHPDYGSADLTHANAAYGARLMKRILAFAGEPAGDRPARAPALS